MSIYSQWNPENDEAIFSPGDQLPLSTLTQLEPVTQTTDKALEFDLQGTILNKV